jgi:transcription termination/antitermination protein NusA
MPRTNPSSDAAAAVDEIAASHHIDPMGLWQAVADALHDAYRRLPGAHHDVDVRINTEDFAIAVVSFDGNPDGVDVTPADFGRVAAATFKEAIERHVAETVRARAVERLTGQEGTVVEGVVRHVTERRAVIDVDGVEGVLPVDEFIPGERLRTGSTVAALLVALRDRGDDVMRLSRSRTEFVRRLVVERIPEVADGQVELVRVARIPGKRSKILVAAAEGLRGDPAGVVIGPGGSKIRNVTRELADERVDVVAWDGDMTTAVAAALGVETTDVEVHDPVDGDDRWKAVVRVPGHLLARAVGAGGVNVTLAERLLGVRIDLGPRQT